MIEITLLVSALENTTITKQGYTFNILHFDWSSMEFNTSRTTDTKTINATIEPHELLELLSIERI